MLQLTEKNYHAAIIENFPQLPIETWEPLYEGWANRTFLVNQRIVFRFPKHQVAARGLVREMRLLTELAPTVPLPIPQYLYHGQPTQYYPFVFGGYAFINGTPLNQCSPQVQSATWWQPPLGDFLTALHRFPIDRVQDLFESDVYTTSQTWREGITKMWGKIRTCIFPRLTHRQQEEITT
ncbi:phosphotransferase [Candidatus Poribacteria bacterium]|nr:phosphotransferase [Candidatus Poribacteria bacterium]